MDFNVPKTFVEFKLGWYRGINFDQEADLFLNELNNAKKENDIQVVSGATISSKSIVNAVNAAVNLFNKMEG